MPPFFLARDFYKTVFAWTFKEPSTTTTDLDATSDPTLGVDFTPLGVDIAGGIQPVPEPTGVLGTGSGGRGLGLCVYWLVEDLDKIGGVIQKAGGKMLSGKHPEGKFGMYRFFEDTEGNVGSVYQFLELGVGGGEGGDAAKEKGGCEQGKWGICQ